MGQPGKGVDTLGVVSLGQCKGTLHESALTLGPRVGSNILDKADKDSTWQDKELVSLAHTPLPCF